jgi:hypothetical protein
VDELFELISKWEASCRQLPALVDRLIALRSVHEESAAFAATLRQLDAEQNQIAQLLKTNLSTLKQVLSDALKEACELFRRSRCTVGGVNEEEYGDDREKRRGFGEPYARTNSTMMCVDADAVTFTLPAQ